ncbi:hypothetical protein SERLA73DRAFT_170536 [Serpula lacrymans var. lacrymans S7.3]|uniref:Phosphoglycerate mutase-like protein n=2 Tax=Serpula lacrymans var. lacrymans TaxID=341189 RepID=F8Q682_SERL3|nr:uncharacterized protein SERLADRAFT_451672 [Serpula lacrymans var. lacrymans S7.9]EGN96120.1 hypothetical protein SERLA73DRAFT_170536 [Serpula lacrymans var. lacrymans S7.3]EGO21658.1 hypothetical protein SERLADRAFT_451672 [Serpula lacrymans var. lacrymans S7.9]
MTFLPCCCFCPSCLKTIQGVSIRGSLFDPSQTHQNISHDNTIHALASGDVGSPEWHQYPPASPTNAFPDIFPTDVGYAGATRPGAEPGLVATAPSVPIHTGAPQLAVPSRLPKAKGPFPGAKKHFDMFQSWGSLSPWYSIERGHFGVDSGPEAPESCRITGLHLLHRHGARNPADYKPGSGPGGLAFRLHANATSLKATGPLSFLNEWTYKLGQEGLSAYGRAQLFDLGVSMRMKYGFLLNNFTESNTIPVFRTTSQTRMLASAQNFALGFFGFPYDGQYQQVVTIEAPQFNNTLAPFETCANNNVPSKGYRGSSYVQAWTDRYLKDAVHRLQRHLHGYTLTVNDVYAMQESCAYETVVLGYSKFCELFTEKEWEGFDYAADLKFWYGVAFGSPVAKAQGVGYVQELVSRLTETPLETHNSSTNATMHNPVQFPLGNSLYVDATHETVILNVITALNLSSFAKTGPLPSSHIPSRRTFRSSELAPFATNIQFQLLCCDSKPERQIRVIINDGVVPLTGVGACSKQKDGMCAVSTFVEAQKETIRTKGWAYACSGEWDVPAGPAWETTTGEPPVMEE